jgi:hypothetical protein
MDPDPDLTPDQTLFFSDFKDGKKCFFVIFSLYLVHRHIIFSLQNFIFGLNFVSKFYSANINYFSPLNTFLRKGKDPEPDLYR